MNRIARSLLVVGALWLVAFTASFTAVGQDPPPAPQAAAAKPPAPTPFTPLAAPTTTFLLNTKSEPAKAAFFAGYDAMLELDFARAAAEFKRAYATDPQLRIARAYELAIHENSFRTGDEIERLRIRNGSPNTVETLAFMALRESAYGRSGSPTLLNAARRLAPTDNRLLMDYHRGLSRGTATRIAIARTLRDQDPNSYATHGWLAIALTAAADRAEATKAMEEALRLGPDRPFAHWAAGEVLTLRREFDAAIAQYTKALELDPNYYQALGDRAATQFYANRPAEARKDLQLLRQRSVSSVISALSRRADALSYLHEGNVEEATRQMTRVAQEMTSEKLWRSQLALAHQHLAMLAAVKRDVSAIEREIKAQQQVLTDEDRGGSRFWNAVALSFAASPVRAREELTAYQQLVESRDYQPVASEIAAVTATVLVAERKFDEALKAAGTSANHFAAIARYQALNSLGRKDEANAQLKPVLEGSGYALDNMAVPIARMLFGKK